MEIVFSNVDFSYNSDKIFDKFSCKINSNMISAFVGATGSGKST